MMIIIISCGKKKQDHACAAGEMYTGPYHRALREWALSVTAPENIFILSSKYGLLALSKVIEPYEMRLGDAGSITADELRKQARRAGLLNRGAEILLCGGKDYTGLCSEVWPEARAPLTGAGGFGKQMAYLKKNKGKLI